MGLSKTGCVVVFVLIGLMEGRPCLGAENEIQLRPRVARPGRSVTVRLAQRLEPGKKVSLRLTGPTPVDDLPAGTEASIRGLLRMTLPKEMRQGRYEAELVTEQGDVLATGGQLRILATEAPVITKIVPHPSYAADGTYSFELSGENFGSDAADNTVRINDVPIAFEERLTNRGKRYSAADCAGKQHI